jgi:hypothetical protein
MLILHNNLNLGGRRKVTKTNMSMFIFMLVLGISSAAFGSVPGSQGANLYQLKCGRCHEAYNPQKYSPNQWKTIIKEMGPLAGLNKESEKKILDYVVGSSKKKDSKIPTDPVLGGYLYSEFFSSKDSVDTFDIHYLNLNLSGRLHKRVTYRAEFELEHGGGESEPPFVEQAYIDVWIFRNAALRIGALLTPFNRFDDFHAPLLNFLITRPQMSREIGNSAWKEVGIDFHGNLFVSKDLYLNYDLYVINGLGSGSRLRTSRQYRDNNDAKSIGFRLSSVFLDKLEAGVSFYQGAWDDPGDLDLNVYGVHLMGKLGNLDIRAEYALARSENPKIIEPGAAADLEKGKADGYFIQASYLINGKFRPTVRYGTLDYLDMGNLFGRKPIDLDTKVIALGFNYYLTQSIVFKVEYDIIREGDRKTDKENDLFALQAAVRF